MPLKNKYNTYQIEDFICDEAFISWVKEGEEDDFWKNWTKENPEKAPLVDQAKDLVVQLSERKKTEHPSIKKQVWEKIDASTTPKIVRKEKGRIRWIAAAAAVAASVALFFLWTPTGDHSTEFLTESSQTEKITLADNSVIVSNENSSIRYVPDQYNANQRQIELDGEAFFKVKPGKKFEVKTTNGTVQVLGTSFNILSRGDVFEVKCFTGKVKVTNNQGAEVILVVGENTILTNNQLVKKEHNAKLGSPQWMQAYKNYFDVELRQISKEIETYYDIKVVLEKTLEHKKVTANFRYGTLEETAKTITWPLNLYYDITSDTLRIYATQK